MEIKTIVKKDWNWFLAEVEWFENIYAYWETIEEAKVELLNVAEMLFSYYTEQVTVSKKLKTDIKKSLCHTSL